MLLAPHDARRFMATYERVAIAVQAINQQQAASDTATCLVTLADSYLTTLSGLPM